MSKKRTILGVGDYAFKDKCPSIDMVRTLIQIEASLRRVKFWTIVREISKDTGISVSCFWSWFDGPTVMPRFAYIQAVAMWFDAPMTLRGIPVKTGWVTAYKAKRSHLRLVKAA